MKNFLTDEEKKILRRNCRYLASIGMKIATVETDGSNGEVEFEYISWEYFTHYSNNFSAEILPAVLPIIKKIYKIANDMGPFEVVDENGNQLEYLNYERFELIIDCQDGEIVLNYDYGYYADGSTTSMEYENEGGELDELFDSLDESNSWEDNTIIGLTYDGSGDSGYLESTFTNGASVPSVIKTWCENEIINNYPGWEDNEGAYGEFTFNKKEKTISLEHTYREETSGLYEVLKESFK